MSKFLSRIVALVCILCATSAMSAANSLKISATEIMQGVENEISMELTADGAFTGFQVTVTLSDGLSFVAPGAELGATISQSHQLSAHIDGNTLKLVCFSNSNSTLETSGTLLNLKVKASDTFSGGTISITDAIFSSTGNSEVTFPLVTVNVESKPYDPLIYSYDESTLTATVTGASEDIVNLVIPDEVRYNGKNYKVTAIGSRAFCQNPNIRSGNKSVSGTLTIGKYVTKIGICAFSDCFGLTGSLTLPNSVTEIGDSAFEGCHGFTGMLTLPNSVTEIGGNAFSCCSGFTGSLNIPNSVTKISDGAFSHCSGFTGTLTIPDSVTKIGGVAFYGCRGFTGSLIIPDSVTVIGDGAFCYCTGFTGTLTIGNSVTTIGSFAFDGCSGFTGSLTIPDSVTEIGDGAFEDCHGFTGSLTIPNSVTEIGSAVFCDCTGFTGSLSIPNSVTKIGPRAFQHCTGFTGSLTIGNSVTEIGYMAFHNCFGFTGSLTIGNSVTEIGDAVFHGCSGFNGSLTIPGSVTKIGDYAFFDCSGFTGALIVPESVPEIGYATFFGCSGLSDIRIYNPEVISINDNAFPEEIMIRIPAGSGEKYRSAEHWADYDAADRLYEFGDANLSKSLTVTDAVAAANNIIGAENETFDFICADINQDDRVSISDVTGIIDAVLQFNPEGATSARRMPLNSCNTLIADNFALDSRGDAQVGVHLVAATEFVALQADIAAGNGITIDAVELSPELAATHSLTTARLGDGTMRVILFSAANAPVRTGDGTIMSVSIHADGEAADLAISNIIGATATASESALGFKGGVNTGYAGISDLNGGEITVTAAGGNIVIANAEGTEVTVTDIAGRTVACFTADTDCCTIPMQHGIYIVTAAGKTAKITL